MSLKNLCLVFIISSLFTVSVKAECVGCTCLLSTNALNFGSGYNAMTNRANDTFANIAVICHSPNPIVNASFTIASDPGTRSDFTSRALISGNHSLNYNLYIDSAYTRIWGDGTGGTNVIAASCSSTQTLPPYSCTHTFTVYGKIPGGQSNTIGGVTFTNTINATLNY